MFSIGEPRRTKLFAELKASIEKLKTLLKTSDKTQVLLGKRAAAQHKLSDSALGKFCEHANRMFSLITDAWGCKCTSKHEVNLQLQHRTTLEDDFHLIFLKDPTEPAASPAWNRQGVGVKIIDGIQGNSCSVKTYAAVAAPVTPNVPNHRSISLRSSILRSPPANRPDTPSTS